MPDFSILVFVMKKMLGKVSTAGAGSNLERRFNRLVVDSFRGNSGASSRVDRPSNHHLGKTVDGVIG